MPSVLGVQGPPARRDASLSGCSAFLLLGILILVIFFTAPPWTARMATMLKGPLRSASKAIDLPSGDHDGPTLRPPDLVLVIWTRPPPVARIVKTFHVPPRSLAKAMRLPPGDQAGSWSMAGPLVSCRSRPVARFFTGDRCRPSGRCTARMRSSCRPGTRKSRCLLSWRWLPGHPRDRIVARPLPSGRIV